MRIYPDSELPDLTVSWDAASCRANIGDVAIIATGVDQPADLEARVPCADGMVVFRNVARVRYTIDGMVYTVDGVVFTMASSEADLRNGFDHESSLYFDLFDNVRVAWTFAAGASCASLGADVAQISFSTAVGDEAFAYSTSCESTPFFGTVSSGDYSIVVSAMSGGSTLASSPPSASMAVFDDGFTDFGSVELVPN
jgi:hypothetical protein